MGVGNVNRSTPNTTPRADTATATSGDASAAAPSADASTAAAEAKQGPNLETADKVLDVTDSVNSLVEKGADRAQARFEREARPKGFSKKEPRKGTKAHKRWRQEKAAVKRANQGSRASRAAAASKAAKASKVAKVAKAAGPVVTVVAAGVTAVDQYQKSTAQTTAGKVVNAGASTAADVAFGVAAPPLAIVDGLTGGHASDHLKSSVTAITTVGEGLITGDTRGMESFHESSKRGEYGPVMQAASEAGDYWAEHGVVGGLKNFWNEIW